MGDPTDIVYRSGWERSVFVWLDNNPICVGWGSETIIVPYFSPIDNRTHRYFVDLKAIFKYPDGKTKTFLIEIKPKQQTVMPKTQNKSQKRLVEEVSTYAVNRAKWEAASEYARKKGWEFKVITEDEIYGAKKK